MKRIFLTILLVFAASAAGVSAQSFGARRNFEKGVRLAGAENFETALVDFKTALTLAAAPETDDDFRAKIHFNIGVCLYRLKRNAAAVDEFNEAIKLRGGDYEKALYALGMAEAELKNWPEAEAAFRGALRLNRRNGETWFDLAFVYLAQKDYRAAGAAFEKSVEYKSVAAPVGHNNLGVIRALSGDFAAAVKEFEKALKMADGKMPEAARNLEFCRSLGQNAGGDLTAQMEFGK